MSNPLLSNPKTDAPCLAMRPREAARALGVSERTLWTWTREGSIPHVRRGALILYPVDALRRWLDEQVKATATPEAAGLVEKAPPPGGEHDPR